MKPPTDTLARPTHTSRRRLIIGAAAFAAILTGQAWKQSGGPSSVEVALLSVLHQPGSAANVGRKVLHAAPDLRRENRLSGLLLARLGLDPVTVMALSSHELGQRVAERVRGDFSHDLTISIDGWVLSATEAWLCALAANCRG